MNKSAERYRLVAVNSVSTSAVPREVRTGKTYLHTWQVPTDRKYLIRCTIDRHGKHYRVVAKSGPSSMGFTWNSVSHFDRVFL